MVDGSESISDLNHEEEECGSGPVATEERELDPDTTARLAAATTEHSVGEET